jgi:hypothetical protein
MDAIKELREYYDYCIEQVINEKKVWKKMFWFKESLMTIRCILRYSQ